MVIEYIRYELKGHTPDELIAAYERAGEHLRAAPECEGFELARCEEAPKTLTLRIKWRSTQAHLEGFRKGVHFPPFLQEIRPFIGEVAEMRHYAPSDVRWSRA